MSRRCEYADKATRGERSPECFPGPSATHIVRGYFITTKGRAPMYLCRAHAEYHAHLNPECIRKGGGPASAPKQQDVWYDYEHQAWVVDGRYSKCGHPAATRGCYACIHAGELAPVEHRRTVEANR